MDCSLPGSSVHGIFQARVLEWGAIALSSILQYNKTKYPQSGTDLVLVITRMMGLPDTSSLHILTKQSPITGLEKQQHKYMWW